MDEREQPRTWKINNSEDDCWVGDGPLMAPEEGPILVVELELILNLLERAIAPTTIIADGRRVIQDFLRSHGRLTIDV
jgi:hypothetical protein